jgi:hypothetical protein
VLLHLIRPRHAEAGTVVWCQIVRASSAIATASRRVTGASAASSKSPRRTFWIKACPAITTLALWSCLSPPTGRSLALSYVPDRGGSATNTSDYRGRAEACPED